MAKKETITKEDLMVQLESFTQLLTPLQLIEMFQNYTILHLKKNELLYTEGDVPQYMYCLLRGKIKITKDGVGGRMQIVRVVKPVEIFGYRPYFINQNFVTSASAFENCMLCAIPLDMVYRWIESNNRVAIFFIKQLATDLGLSDQRTVSLTQKHIRGRLAESLLFLMERYGMEEGSSTLSIYLSREDLASLSNMTTSNAIRTLSAFANEHIIGLDGRKIMLIDIEQLRRISNFG